MSRSHYGDDLDVLELGRWRGMVASATRGQRGQKFFKDLLAAMDAMPEKVLISDYLEKDGDVCAIGCLGRARGIDMQGIDPEEYEVVADKFDIAECLAQEVFYMNDEWGLISETPQERWIRMHRWVRKQINDNAPAAEVSNGQGL